ncbi:MAG: HAD family hydrolase [Candidatus Bathyarchaeia archaeon]
MNGNLYSRLGNVLLRDDADEQVSSIKRIVFDCDGVLVSDRNSYRKAIIQTVDYYFLELVKLKGEMGKLVTHNEIQRIKDTGAFNNDWNLTYMLIIYYLGLMLSRLIGEIDLRHVEKAKFKSAANLNKIIDVLEELGSVAERLGVDITYLERMKKNRNFGLNKLIRRFDGKLNVQVSREIQLFLRLKGRAAEIAENLCPFRISGDDLLRRLFDEIYLGHRLYEKFTGKKSLFKFERGLIEEERVIPTMKTLEMMRWKFGSFGMYSERPRREALYTLRRHGILKYFGRNVLFFNEDILGGGPQNLDLGKPDPRPFLRLLKTLASKNQMVAYVGDTVTDSLLVRNVKASGVKNLLFIGALSSSTDPEKLKSRFMELGAEAIVYDVNSIPDIIEGLKI